MTLKEIFDGIDRARVAVVGDYCLDVYWLADMTRSELSRETPHFPLPVVEERMSPGGAGNVACNVAALLPAKVTALGAIGVDWRGSALKAALTESGVCADGLVEIPGRVTNAYCKPLRKGISDVIYEDPRLDFENAAPLSQDAQDALIERLNATDADVLCVCDQTRYGCIGDAVRRRLCDMGESGRRVIVDSRDDVSLYENVIVKPNEVEAIRAVDAADFVEAARKLSQRTRRPAIVTLGGAGCLVCENDVVSPVAALPVEQPIDICGAGDTFLSALACALAAGADMQTAAKFANTASAVTIRKLRTTGTATREEMEALWNP